MTSTTPGCPVSEPSPDEAEAAVSWALGPSTPVTVEVVSDPPWTPERISDTVADRLGHHRRGR